MTPLLYNTVLLYFKQTWKGALSVLQFTYIDVHGLAVAHKKLEVTSEVREEEDLLDLETEIRFRSPFL